MLNTAKQYRIFDITLHTSTKNVLRPICIFPLEPFVFLGTSLSLFLDSLDSLDSDYRGTSPGTADYVLLTLLSALGGAGGEVGERCNSWQLEATPLFTSYNVHQNTSEVGGGGEEDSAEHLSAQCSLVYLQQYQLSSGGCVSKKKKKQKRDDQLII